MLFRSARAVGDQLGAEDPGSARTAYDDRLDFELVNCVAECCECRGIVWVEALRDVPLQIVIGAKVSSRSLAAAFLPRLTCTKIDPGATPVLLRTRIH